MVDELKVIGSIINKFQKYKLETYDDYEKYFEDQITMFRQIEQAIPRFSIIRFLYAEISHIHGNNDIHFQMHKKNWEEYHYCDSGWTLIKNYYKNTKPELARQMLFDICNNMSDHFGVINKLIELTATNEVLNRKIKSYLTLDIILLNMNDIDTIIETIND